ncbi:hypothetical protein HDV01_006266 [Terramyces sp. JEL0728]|nr:hypothetical protein HDV01_006266 [Terramyces sp. JEL0728]
MNFTIDLGYDYEIKELEEINSQLKLAELDLPQLEKKPVLVTTLDVNLKPVVDSALKVYEYKGHYIVHCNLKPQELYNASKYILQISSKTTVLQVDSSSPDNNDGIQVFKKKGNSKGVCVGIGASLLTFDDNVTVYKILDNYSFTNNLKTVLKGLDFDVKLFKLPRKESSMFL